MTKTYMAILNLEENEQDIRSLTAFRPIATIPFAGRYRLIDFALSNIIHAHITQVGIFISKNTRSLIDHIGNGKPWDLNRKIGGLFTFNHSLLGYDQYDVKMFGDNMEYLQKSIPQNVIISSSYMICNIDLQQVMAEHEKAGNDITIVYKKTEDGRHNYLNCSTLNLDSKGRVISASKNIGVTKTANICAEIFLMKKAVLMRLIYKAVQLGYHGNFNQFLYKNLDRYQTGTYSFSGSLQCINSVQSYFNANMNLLHADTRTELFSNPNGPIYTKTKDSPPALYGENSRVENCLLADGCQINGHLKNCILSRFVKIHPDTVLENCIVFQDATIQRGVRLSNVIVEKGVTVAENTQIVGMDSFPIVIERKNYSGIFEPIPE